MEVELTEEEQRGVAAIIYLQAMAGIDEPPAKALAGWRGFRDGERQSTMNAFALMSSAREAAVLPDGDLEITLFNKQIVRVPRKIEVV